MTKTNNLPTKTTRLPQNRKTFGGKRMITSFLILLRVIKPHNLFEGIKPKLNYY